MSDESYDIAEYDKLVIAMNGEMQVINPEFLKILKLLHSYDHGQPTSHGALIGLEAKADEFSKEIITAYRILVSELTADSEYSWIIIALIDGMLAIKNSTGDRDTVFWLLEQGLMSANSLHRYTILSHLERAGLSGNRRARSILWNARSHEFGSQEETKEFRTLIYDALAKIDG